MSSELVKHETAFGTIGAWFNDPRVRNQIAAAVPKDMSPQRIARVALSVIKDNAKLQECSVDSLIGVLMLCAQTGLEPGPVGHCAIIPRKIAGKMTACWQPMYKGLVHLAWRSEMISGLVCEVVYERDTIDVDLGRQPPISHRPLLTGDRGRRIGAYAQLTTTSGGAVARYMSFEEIEKIRKQYSKDGRDSAAWVTEWDEMACKTVLKRTMKRAPSSTEAKVAIGRDDEAETGKWGRIEIEVNPVADEPKKQCDYAPDGRRCALELGHDGDHVPE